MFEMLDGLEWLAALFLFGFGLWLSAFFSGSETGFYRVSVPRLSIDARAGDAAAARLFWFAQHPAYFVATCLIGNNVANYVCTAAIGWGVVLLFGQANVGLEVAATLVASPVIFQFGELLPKNIYYLAPLSRLKRGVRRFQWFFRLFAPFSWPLVQLTRLLESTSGRSSESTPILLGRSRLMQLMQHGRSEGVLTDQQSLLANGLLQLAPQTVMSSMIPATRVLGVSEDVGRQEMIDFARSFGVAAVAVHRRQSPTAWYGYAFVAELLLRNDPEPLIHAMPQLSHKTSKLEALHRLQVNDASYAVIHRDGEALGIIARNGLVEQICRPEVAATSRAFA